MAIPIICGSCKAKMDVPDQYAGTKGQCSSCKATIVVPWPKGLEVPANARVVLVPIGASSAGPFFIYQPDAEVPVEMDIPEEPSIKNEPPPVLNLSTSVPEPVSVPVSSAPSVPPLFWEDLSRPPMRQPGSAYQIPAEIDLEPKRPSRDEASSTEPAVLPRLTGKKQNVEAEDGSYALKGSSRGKSKTGAAIAESSDSDELIGGFRKKGTQLPTRAAYTPEDGKSQNQGGAATTVVGLVCLAIAVAIGLAVYNKQSQDFDLSTWHPRISHFGDFAIDMPGEPQTTSKANPFGGKPGQQIRYQGSSIGLSIEVLPLPINAPSLDERQTAALLRLFLDSIRKEQDTRILAGQLDQRVFDKPCLQLKLEVSGANESATRHKVDTLMFIDGSAMYILEIAYLRTKPAKFSPNKVFETFQFATGKRRLKISPSQDIISQADPAWLEGSGLTLPQR